MLPFVAMNLRTRLFLLFGGVTALIGIAAWWLVQELTRDLSDELGQVAFAVGKSVVEIFSGGGDEPHADEDRDLRFRYGAVHTLDGTQPFSELHHTRTIVAHASTSGDPAHSTSRVMRPTPRFGSEPAEPEVRHWVEKRSDGTRVFRAEQVVTGPERSLEMTFETEESTLESARLEVRENLLVGLEESPDFYFVTVRSDEHEESIPVPRAGVEAALARFSRRLYLGSLGLLGSGLLLVALVAHRVSRPLHELVLATETVGAGRLGAQVPVTAGGEVGRAVEAFNQMSARLAELEETARTARDRRHLSELGEVARGLAHSLRNPLNALGLSIDEMARRGGDPELAAGAHQQIRRLDLAIRSFLALASGQAGASAPVDLEALARDVALEGLQSGARIAGLAVEAEPDLPPIVGVEAELRAVLQALVVNALEASPEQGKVTIGLSSDGAAVRVTVTDEGPGLPAAVRSRLFTPHVTTKPHGSGMGLFLAHRIATRRYGGRLEIHDRSPRGTEARLRLVSRQWSEGD